MVILIQHLTYTSPPPRHPQLPSALLMHSGYPGISSTSPASEAEDINHEGGRLVDEVGQGWGYVC